MRAPPPDNVIDFDRKQVSLKRIKLESNIISIRNSVGGQKSESTTEYLKSKNLLAPVGTLDHSETSGR